MSGQGRGFTLLELLLALTVSATIAAALSTTLYTAFRARSSAERAIEAARSVEAIGDIVASDLSSALPPTGLLASAFVGETGTVEFYCAGSEYGSEVPGDVRRVRYSLGDDGGADASSLVRRATANLLSPVEAEPREERVCRQVSEVRFEYYDGASWLDSWDSTQHSDTLPVAVRVTLTRSVQNIGAGGIVAGGNGGSNSISRLIAIPCGVSEATLAAAEGGAQ